MDSMKRQFVQVDVFADAPYRGNPLAVVVDADAVREATGYAIGGVPPFGHSTQLRVFVDPDLLQYDEVWAAAGTWNDNFGAAPADIVRVAGGVVTELKRT